MGHLLATVNPEAAAAIQPKVVAPKDMPSEGTLVQYFARPGEGRRGGNVFGAMVTRAYDNGTIDGIAFYDADDFRNLERVPQRSEHHEYPAWDWREEEVEPAEQALERFHRRILALENLSVSVDTTLAGPEFEARIKRLEDLLSWPFVNDVATVIGALELRFQDAVAGLAKSIAPLEDKVHRLELAKHEARISDDWSKVAEKRFDVMEAAINRFSDAIAGLMKSVSAKSNLSDVEARLDALEDKRSGVAAKLWPSQREVDKIIGEDMVERAKEKLAAMPKPKPAAKVKKRKKRRKAKRARLPTAEDVKGIIPLKPKDS